LSPSLQQREEAALATERALAAEVERISGQRAALMAEAQSFEAKRQSAPIALDPVMLPEVGLDSVLSTIRLVREDALRQRLEAVQLLEQRLEMMRKGMSRAMEQLAASNAQLEMARLEAERAAQRLRAAYVPKPAPAFVEVPGDDQGIGDTLMSSLPSLAKKAQLQLNGQRRSARRVNLVAAVDLHSETNFFNGFSSDISSGGLFVSTVEHAPIGTKIDLEFTLPTGEKISAEGEVRWMRELSDVQPELLPGVGVSFTRIAPESVRAIETFVADRDPIFFPDA
jgi:uncharacterized protein (TIGR02266 family)